MRILYHFRTRGTGAEAVHIAGISSALETLGHSVVFSSPTGVDPRQTAGQSPYRNQGEPGFFARFSRNCPGFIFELMEIGYNLVAFLRNRSLLKQGKFDLIYERHAFFLCASAFLGLPVILEVNELVGDQRVRAQPLFSALARWTDQLIFRHAALIVVVSPHLKRRIVESGVTADKVLVLPNAVNREEFASVANGSLVREKYRVEEKIVIGFIGWFVEWHRLDRLVEVFARLSANRDDLVLMLVGEGELRDSLELKARKLGVEGKLLFTGSAPHCEVPGYIAAMDICVVPHSNDYRSPIKLFEYMGQSKAVLAPRLEPVEMIIEDGISGLLFESDSAESLQTQLERLIADKELRRDLGGKARAQVLANHTWGHNVSRILSTVSGSTKAHP